MGSAYSNGRSSAAPRPPKQPPATGQLSLSRYLVIHACVKAAKKMNLYVTWLCDFESNHSREVPWSCAVADRLSDEFDDYLRSISAKDFTEREIDLYEAIRKHSKEIRIYHERVRLFKNMTN